MRNLALLVCLSALLGSSSALFEYLEQDAKAMQMKGFCRDMSCAPREDLLKTINQLRTKVKVQEQINADSNCTVCFSDPCQNGGTCYPLSVTSYRCECPDNYTGANCETEVVCREDSCGANADCYVQNHQINCICQKGMSGDPRTGCSLQTRTSCFNGDPHYNTFDGTVYDYQGTCPFVFSQPCGALYGGFDFYSVKAQNHENAPQSPISTVVSTEVQFYNKSIFVDRDLHIYVNDILVHVPYYYPSKDAPQITISSRGSSVIIENDQYVKVEFQFGQLCLTIPDVPAFRKTGALCGLAGDNDYNCTNDFRKQDGTILTHDSCSSVDQATTDDFGDDWINLDYKHHGGVLACADGKSMTNSSTECNLEHATIDCQAIFAALNATGPFAGCQALGKDAILQAYDSCLYDVCRMEELKCSVLTNFVHTCQKEVPYVSIHGWRDDPTVQCPITCPANSVYDECVSSCPATCSDHTAPDRCNSPCAEGCACDYGYVLDNTILDRTVCIPIQECGCSDDSGNFHPAGNPWFTNNCEQENQCINGTYTKNTHACSAVGHCDIVNYQEGCVCNTGYEGDGDNCEDIDECQDPNSCSAGEGYGDCTNTPGSYKCDCHEFYEGDNCETYAPRRHCADLYVYHNIRDSGVYDVFPPFHPNNQSKLTVYCDMETEGGGWTLMGNTIENGTAGRSYDEYRAGFGNASTQDVWLGLEAIYGYTAYQETSLRLSLFRCARNNKPDTRTECTYPHFSLLDPSTGYQVNITEECSGTEQEFYDGWARWDLTKAGPPFIAYDNDESLAHCSESFHNTGFWFDTSYRCGSANLNGIRYTCDNLPDQGEIQTYLWWGGSSLNKVDMMLRPAQFPDYDVQAAAPEEIMKAFKKTFKPNMNWF